MACPTQKRSCLTRAPDTHRLPMARPPTTMAQVTRDIHQGLPPVAATAIENPLVALASLRQTAMTTARKLRRKTAATSSFTLSSRIYARLSRPLLLVIFSRFSSPTLVARCFGEHRHTFSPASFAKGRFCTRRTLGKLPRPCWPQYCGVLPRQQMS